jgi:hypothetical protein
MSLPLNLEGPPDCIVCGAPMTVTEWPGEGPEGAPMFSAVCSADREGAHGELVDRLERPTWRNEPPGCAALVAEIERLRAEAAEADRALLCERGDKTGAPDGWVYGGWQWEKRTAHHGRMAISRSARCWEGAASGPAEMEGKPWLTALAAMRAHDEWLAQVEVERTARRRANGWNE